MRGAWQEIISGFATIAIVLLFIWVTYSSGIGPTRDLLNSAWAWALGIFEGQGVSLDTSCSIHVECDTWVRKGLGFSFTYADSGVATKARQSNCGIPTSVCPDVFGGTGGSRFMVQDCLEMCIDVLYCESESADPTTCINNVINEVKS